jgi:archaellum component FlaC
MASTNVPLPNEPVIAAVQEDIDDVDELSEQLAAHSIMSEERHDEILERVDQCQSRLEQLSTELQKLRTSETAESPVLSQIQAALESLRTEVASLKSSMDMRLSSPIQPVSEIPVEEPEPVALIEEPRPEEPPAPKPKRFRKL